MTIKTIDKNKVHLSGLPTLLDTLRVKGQALCNEVLLVWKVSGRLQLLRVLPQGTAVPGAGQRQKTEGYLRLIVRRADLAKEAEVTEVFVRDLLSRERSLEQT